jgi:hypothetical protein
MQTYQTQNIGPHLWRAISPDLKGIFFDSQSENSAVIGLMELALDLNLWPRPKTPYQGED